MGHTTQSEKRTEENRPVGNEQDLADTSPNTRVREIVMGIILGSYPGCLLYASTIWVRKGRRYENKYTSMILKTTITPNIEDVITR